MADLAEVRGEDGPVGPEHGCAHAAERRDRAGDALARAEALCAARGLRLTPIRREVLETMLATHRPLGAYDIADRLADRSAPNKPGARRRLAPITVYRALDFLMDEGLVHRLASRNAYIVCPHADHAHADHAHAGHAHADHSHAGHGPVAFLICDTCGGVDEMASAGLVGALRGLVEAEGFEPRAQVLEITGLCAHCRPAAPA